MTPRLQRASTFRKKQQKLTVWSIPKHVQELNQSLMRYTNVLQFLRKVYNQHVRVRLEIDRGTCYVDPITRCIYIKQVFFLKFFALENCACRSQWRKDLFNAKPVPASSQYFPQSSAKLLHIVPTARLVIKCHGGTHEIKYRL